MADDHEYDRRHNQVRFNLNGRIMITAIVCLFVVVVLVLLLHIYARCVLRRQARRRAALQQFGTAGATATTTQLHSTEPPKRGLNQSVISSLPVFVYKQVDHLGDTEAIECSVCLSILEDEEIARLLPNCKHTFHQECIDMWLTTHSTCPICRTEAEPQVQPESTSTSTSTSDGFVVVVTNPMAPSVDLINSTSMVSCSEGTSDSTAKASGSSSRLNSFRRMLSRDRSSRRIQTSEQAVDVVGDIERQ